MFSLVHRPTENISTFPYANETGFTFNYPQNWVVTRDELITAFYPTDKNEGLFVVTLSIYPKDSDYLTQLTRTEFETTFIENQFDTTIGNYPVTVVELEIGSNSSTQKSILYGVTNVSGYVPKYPNTDGAKSRVPLLAVFTFITLSNDSTINTTDIITPIIASITSDIATSNQPNPTDTYDPNETITGWKSSTLTYPYDVIFQYPKTWIQITTAGEAYFRPIVNNNVTLSIRNLDETSMQSLQESAKLTTTLVLIEQDTYISGDKNISQQIYEDTLDNSVYGYVLVTSKDHKSFGLEVNYRFASKYNEQLLKEIVSRISFIPTP